MKILYVSFIKPNYSIDGVYINGLRRNGATVVSGFFQEKSWARYRRAYQLCRQHRDADYVIVGHASPKLATFLSLATNKKIIFNALCSEYERMIVSRALGGRMSLNALRYWAVDFFACHLSHLVMVETAHQIDYFVKLFKISRNKCFLAWTGVDEQKFHYDPSVAKFERFTVIFRGRLLPEAGGEYVVEAAKILENEPIDFLMLSSGMELPKVQKLIDGLKPKNLTLITEFLSDEEMLKTMQRSHLSLGQLSNHERLQRTIPHKAYETIALRLPYLTARNPAVMELFTDNQTCLVCNPADANDLAVKILWAKNHPAELDRIAENGYQMYQKDLMSKILAARLLKVLTNAT